MHEGRVEESLAAEASERLGRGNLRACSRARGAAQAHSRGRVNVRERLAPEMSGVNLSSGCSRRLARDLRRVPRTIAIREICISRFRRSDNSTRCGRSLTIAGNETS